MKNLNLFISFTIFNFSTAFANIRIAATGDILVHNAQQIEAAAHPEKFYFYGRS